MSSAAVSVTSPEPVFRARGLTKVYRMGDVEVHALRGVDLDGKLVLKVLERHGDDGLPSPHKSRGKRDDTQVTASGDDGRRTGRSANQS